MNIEPVSYVPPVVPSSSHLELDVPESDTALVLQTPFRGRENFVPDGQPVVDALVGTRQLVGAPSGSSRDYLRSYLVSNGVSKDRADRLAEVLVGCPPHELSAICSGVNNLSRSFPNVRVPDDGKALSDPEIVACAEDSLRALVLTEPMGIAYVLPSRLMDYVKSISTIEMTQRDNATLLYYVGSRGSGGIELPPYSHWTDVHVDMVVSFVNRLGFRVVSFPLEFEKIARCAYYFSKYSFGPEFKIQDVRASVAAARHRGDSFSLSSGRMGDEFVAEVSHFLSTFASVMVADPVPEGLRFVKPHVVACLLMRENRDRSKLVESYRKYLSVVPSNVVSYMQGNGKVEWKHAVLEATQRPSMMDMPDHPECDPIQSMNLGYEGGRTGEIADVMQKCKMIEVLSSAVVVTGKSLSGALRKCADNQSTGVETLAWFNARSMPDGFPFRSFNQTAVVLARGEHGGFNDAPNAGADLKQRCAEMEFCVSEIRNRAPEHIAVCGPFSGAERVPLWLVALGQSYVLKLGRANMGVYPAFWAYGVRGHTGVKEIASMMDEVFIDLHLAGLVRQDMARRGAVGGIYCFDHVTTDDSRESGTFRVLLGACRWDCDLANRAVKQVRRFFRARWASGPALTALRRAVGK